VQNVKLCFSKNLYIGGITEQQSDLLHEKVQEPILRIRGKCECLYSKKFWMV